MRTIKSSDEISRLFKEGRRISARGFTIIVSRNKKQHDAGRAAFIAGKRLGNAVWRNRAKRRMRAACCEAHGPVRGYDMIFLAKKSVNEVEYQSMLDSTIQALSKLSLKG